jgi:hypothetical protein
VKLSGFKGTALVALVLVYALSGVRINPFQVVSRFLSTAGRSSGGFGGGYGNHK